MTASYHQNGACASSLGNKGPATAESDLWTSRLTGSPRATPARTPDDRQGRKRGFTLIELLVVVAIIAILAAIAYPSYQNSVIKARRTEGQALLLEIAARQEQYHADTRTFTTDMTELGYGMDPTSSENGYYNGDAIAGPTGNIATSFVATATRLDEQLKDTVCYDFTVDSMGRRGTTSYPDNTDPPSGCW